MSISTPIDPIAQAVDWLDAYRAAALNTLMGLFDDEAVLECGCSSTTVISGKTALTAYWRDRCRTKRALDLVDLRPEGDGIFLSYRTIDGVVQINLLFNAGGKIRRARCGPC